MTDTTKMQETALQSEEVAAQPTVPTEQADENTSYISLKTALRMLKTISQNRHEPVAFWASKAAYSGVYRAAVKNGWIEDGVFVTDIPEGVDGGFLGADMIRIALMADLLADVLSDRLPPEETAPAIHSADTDLKELIDAQLATSLADAFGEIEDMKGMLEDILGTLEDLSNDM